MQEQDRLAMGPDLGLAVAEHAGSARFQYIARSPDIVYFVTDVVNATLGMALDKFSDRRRIAERLDEFNFGIWQRDEYRRDAVVGLRHRFGNLRAENVAIDLRSHLDVRHRNRHVIEPS